MNNIDKPSAGFPGTAPRLTGNILSPVSNRVLIPALFFVFGLIGTACYFWGKRDAELATRELKQTVGVQQQKIQGLIDTILTMKLTQKDTITSMQEPLH